MKLIFSVLIIGCLSACSTLPSSFSTDNIMKVHSGMSSDEILKLFGTPKNVGQAVCGAATKQSWTCTTWEYGAFPYDRASFTFSGDDPKSLILNNFKIDRQ